MPYGYLGQNTPNQTVSNSGGAVHTIAQACDGIEFSINLSNIASGTFTLYKVL